MDESITDAELAEWATDEGQGIYWRGRAKRLIAELQQARRDMALMGRLSAVQLETVQSITDRELGEDEQLSLGAEMAAKKLRAIAETGGRAGRMAPDTEMEAAAQAILKLCRDLDFERKSNAAQVPRPTR
jgi:hypothetical protein